LNQRPSGYEKYKVLARLCLSMTYVDLDSACLIVFWGVPFPICSRLVPSIERPLGDLQGRADRR